MDQWVSRGRHSTRVGRRRSASIPTSVAGAQVGAAAAHRCGAAAAGNARSLRAKTAMQHRSPWDLILNSPLRICLWRPAAVFTTEPIKRSPLQPITTRHYNVPTLTFTLATALGPPLAALDLALDDASDNFLLRLAKSSEYIIKAVNTIIKAVNTIITRRRSQVKFTCHCAAASSAALQKNDAPVTFTPHPP
jgi:hypothetical protein